MTVYFSPAHPSASDPLDDATRHITAARNLARMLTCVSLSDLSPSDFSNTCEVFDLLLHDACKSLRGAESPRAS